MGSPDIETNDEIGQNLLIVVRNLVEADPVAFAPVIVPVLAGLLKNPNSANARSTIHVYGELGPLAAGAVPSLTDALPKATSVVQVEILKTLEAIGPAAKRAGELVFQLVKEGTDRVSKAAVTALQSIHGSGTLDKLTIRGYDDYQLFLQHLPDSSELPETPKDDKRPEYLAALLATVPKDAGYDHQAEQLESLRQDVNGGITDRVVSAMKETLQSKEHETYAKKLAIARWVNVELRRFDLTITLPKADGAAATLTADAAGRGGEGRFILRAKAKGENGKYANFTTQNLSELIDHISISETKRREPLVEWRERLSQQPDETGRA